MKRLLLFIAFFVFVGVNLLQAQTVQITGTVTSAEDGESLPGVSVIVKGTTIGTSSNIDGSYSISVPQSATTLEFNFIGFEAQDVDILGRTQIDVILETGSLALEEIVFVAYGTQTKRSLTGSQSAVKGEDLQKSQVSNITRALEGAIAGVQTATESGQPGSGSKVRIRGMGSLSASSSPLYVVDGVPYEGNINSISQVDIENVTVLKDASATSIYGARAANGVILITTKRGTGATPRVVVDSRVGVNSRAYKGYDVMTDPGEYYEMYWEGLRNDRFYNAGLSYNEAGAYASNRLIKYTDPETQAIEWMLGYNNYDVPDNQLIDPFTGELNPNANLLYQERWVDEVFESGIRQDHSFNVSGIANETNYYLSFSYLDDEGYSPNTGFTRYTSRLRLTQDVNKWLTLGGNIAYINSEINNPTHTGPSSANLFYVSEIVAPIYPVYQRNPDGSFVYDAQGEKQYDFGTRDDMKRPVMPIANPAATQQLNIESTQRDKVIMRGNATINFTDDLKFDFNVGLDNDQTNRSRIDNNQIGQFADVGGYIYKSTGLTQTLNTNQILSYTTEINDEHRIDALLGHEYYQWDYSLNYGSKQNFLLPSITEMDWAVVMSSVGSYGYDYSLESYFGRLNYGYIERYYVDASIRRDGSSRFHPDNRWGTFWSVGGSWIINQEAFMQSFTNLDMLKLRASYGSIGQDNLGDYTTARGRFFYYAYEDQYDVVNNDGEVGLTFVYKGNPDLKWESIHQFTAGLDFSFFDRISGNIDYFTRTSYDLLFDLPQPPSTGISEIPYNLGNLSNKGVELELSVDILTRYDFNWNVGLNATHYRTTIHELPELYQEDGLIRGGYQIWEEGSSPYLYYMREYAGVNPETGRGEWYMDVMDEDDNVTGRELTDDWNEADRYKTDKSAIPDVFGGVSTSFEYKGFDLSVQAAYQIGGYVFDGIYRTFMHAGASNDVGSNWHRDIHTRWTPSNTDTDVPIVDRYLQANGISDRFLVRGDYFSLRNIVLGYSLPGRLVNQYDIERIRIYAVADNLFFMSQRQGLDPRLFYSGVTTGGDMSYSPIRTVSVGLNLTF